MRPKKCRKIQCNPDTNYFKPKGIPVSELQEVTLLLEEAEALRLAHLDKLYMEAAGKQMNVSRATFSRILSDAHKKITDAIINGKALKIDKKGEYL